MTQMKSIIAGIGLSLMVSSVAAMDKCIGVDADEESVEVTLYENGLVVDRRIMLVETYRELYCGNYLVCQSSSSSSGGQSTTTSSKQK